MVGIELRGNYSAGDLRVLARKSRNAKQARRLMALAGVADGLSRTEAAAVGLMDRRRSFWVGWRNGSPSRMRTNAPILPVQWGKGSSW
ncbi:MAG: hypothetical protein HRU33_00800 [Rhodobacteraceae bacterium]|nr:hypothetical protein [Paracoccaceae bacterium]